MDLKNNKRAHEFLFLSRKAKMKVLIAYISALLECMREKEMKGKEERD